jgi:hypothetical protein
MGQHLAGVLHWPASDRGRPLPCSPAPRICVSASPRDERLRPDLIWIMRVCARSPYIAGFAR